MGMNAFYDGGAFIDPPLLTREVYEINELIYLHGNKDWPWFVDEFGIVVPEESFRISDDDDGETLKFVVNLLKDKDREVHGEIFISYDFNDALTKLTVENNQVFYSYRLNNFSEPESVTVWKPTAEKG